MENENPNPNQSMSNPEPQKSQPISENKATTYGVIGGVVVLLIVGAILLWKFNVYKPTTVEQNQASPDNTNIVSVQPLGNDSPAPEEPKYPIDEELKAIPNFVSVASANNLNLSPAQQKFLKDNKFLLVDKSKAQYNASWGFDDMLRDFDTIGGSSDKYYRALDDTVLVNPDIVLHTYHKFFEMTLEQLEQKELSQSLQDFLASLHNNLSAAVKQNSGQTQERYQNLLAEITVARVLFENKSGPKPDSFESMEAEDAYIEKEKTVDSFDNAKKILSKYSSGLTPALINGIQTELADIYKAESVGKSPLFGQYSDTLKTDYTQFTPRSHYAKNSQLRAYFRTMMYLGRSSYFIRKDIGITDTNLLTRQFTVKSSTGIMPIDPWQKIMSITGFYAGQSDDLTYNEWQNYKTQLLGASNLTETGLTSQPNIQKMAENLDQIRLPKILSDVIVDNNIQSKTKSDLLRESLSFRVFGQRFSFDGWILNDLTAGEEKTEVALPSMPSALFVQAALGDEQAKKYSGEFLKKDAGFSDSDVAGFFTKLTQKQSDINKVSKSEWFASMGSAWLYVLGSLTHSFDSTYPAYMQSAAYPDKQIQTSLGSFTELKHDTLLYAKQSYAEQGGGGDEPPPLPPVVKGFVEPNLDFWNRFNELVEQTKQTFSKNNLFKDSQVLARLNEFQDISKFYSSIAQKESKNQPITEAEYERLRTTHLSFMVQPYDAATAPDEKSGQVALIADIHTDGVKSKILYEATGRPYLMLAVVDNEKSPRVVVGLVYNHYEFTGELGGNRFTDEAWKTWVYQDTDKLPAKNFWYDSLKAE